VSGYELFERPSYYLQADWQEAHNSSKPQPTSSRHFASALVAVVYSQPTCVNINIVK